MASDSPSTATKSEAGRAPAGGSSFVVVIRAPGDSSSVAVIHTPGADTSRADSSTAWPATGSARPVVSAPGYGE